MPTIDYLIVGGGIAGFAVADYLEAANQNFLIISQDREGAATKVSSGVINPVTGQRLVLSWNYEELKLEFLKFYQRLENKFSQQFIEETQLIQLLRSAEEQNLWLSRTADPLYKNYFNDEKCDFQNDFKLAESVSAGIINSIYLIKIEQLLYHLEYHYSKQNRYRICEFNFNELIRTNDELKWKDLVINKAIIFAEGYRLISNPFFNWLPIVPLKGECLQIKIDGMKLNSVFKSEYAIVPIKDNIYWCGSNFYLFETQLRTTEIEKQHQIDFLNKYLKTSFEIVKHTFGIRPASRDRRPMIGPHPYDPRLIVFNGLGTKGLSLAPFCASHLVQWMVNGVPLPKELNLDRFRSKGIEASAI